MEIKMDIVPDEQKECEDCKKLRKSLTWFGKPPTCYKHRSKLSDYWMREEGSQK